jgi:glycosyltransferase involved in cell wall biosynthesis
MSPAVLPALAPVPTVVTMMDYKAICPVGTRLLPDGSLCTVAQGSVCRRNGCVGTVHWLRDRPRYAFIGSTLRRARRVLCASESMRAELARAGIEAETLHLGVPLPEADFQRAPAESPVFVYCGRLSREKGVALAIAALARLDGKAETARLRIVGDGPLMQELMQLAEVLGVSERVDFTGWVPADRLDDELADTWALVAPSLWAEPFGLVAVEAVVRGIPVIASDVGGMHETVREGASGLLFPNGDVAALTERMRAIAERTVFPDQRIDAATVTRAIDSFGIDGHATRLRTILSDVAAPARN